MNAQTGTFLIVCVSALFILAGAFLSLLGMSYRYSEKTPLLKNAEWGLILIMLLSFVSAIVQANAVLHSAAALPVWMPTIILRILFFWVPLNYYLHVQNEKKEKS